MSVEAVLRELGIDFRIVGDEGMACCPSHDDRHPSWSVNLKTGVHHCFSCGFSGSLAGLAAHVLRLNYPEAVLWVNARVGWARAHQWREDKENTSFSPAKLKIGEADMALFTDPPLTQCINKWITLEYAREFGVRWNPAHDSWIFPVRDPYTHELWGWQEKNARLFRNYPSGVKKSETLFGLSSFVHGSTAVLVESPIDCVRLRTAGIRGGLSSFGVHVSDKQFSIILGVTEQLVLALDNDSAGVEETARILREFKQLSNVRVFNYDGLDVKDPGDMTDSEISRAMNYAVPAIRWANVYRKIRPVPDRASGQVHWTRELISSLHDGIRQDAYSYCLR